MKKVKQDLITKSMESRLHGCPVPVIGLTGGIASGKSTVAKVLMDKGHKVINADTLIKSIYGETETVTFINENWPQVVSDGVIDFKELRKLFFNDSGVQSRIEEFLYKRMPKKFMNEVGADDQFIIYDVPLLFEKGLDKLVDFSVCVYCTRENQIIRLTKRDEIDRELAESIINNQLDIESKSQKSNFIINNNSNMEALNQNIEDFLSQILV